MIELSLGKMVLLALIALIVLGPEKLPGAARTAGALLRRARSGWDNVRAEVERELEIEEIKRSAREAVAGAEAAQQQVKDTLKSAHDPFAEAAAMVRLQAPASSNTVLRPEDMTPEERVTNRHLLNPQPASALPEGQSTSAAYASANHLSPESALAESSEQRMTPRDITHDAVADKQALEGVQSELPLDEPPMNFAHDASMRDNDAHDESRHSNDFNDKAPPHGNA